MATQTSMLHIRVDDDIKEQATAALTTMGLSVSDAVRLFLRRVVIDQAFPLELKVPNAQAQAAMEASRAMMASRRSGESRFASADEMFDALKKTDNHISEVHISLEGNICQNPTRPLFIGYDPNIGAPAEYLKNSRSNRHIRQRSFIRTKSCHSKK